MKKKLLDSSKKIKFVFYVAFSRSGTDPDIEKSRVSGSGYESVGFVNLISESGFVASGYPSRYYITQRYPDP